MGGTCITHGEMKNAYYGFLIESHICNSGSTRVPSLTFGLFPLSLCNTPQRFGDICPFFSFYSPEEGKRWFRSVVVC